MQIEGNLFIVTGGASGLGEDVARHLVQQGAFVSIFDINQERAESIVNELGQEKCFSPGLTDVTQEANVIESMSRTLAHFSQIALAGAILCSGIVHPPKSLEGYGDQKALTSFAQFEHVIKVNLLGTYCVAQKVAEQLVSNQPFNQDQEKGIIITASSMLGLDGALVGYGTSKAGIIGFTLPMARELASHGIRVMSIAPGPFDTPMVDRNASTPTPTALFPSRYGAPAEFTQLVVEIIRNRMLNGSVIRLDGALRV
ncbi:3-hydroxyacyl-CoA dehydrogenase type-2 [Choanephora cucurbitarum]|uniref:3-hydroxyacyl-CoA dehydrogenase type-2 n=1 Tax=Choanephora cucurbitarum TaxID=101091 RepID=A0A1C7NCX2_9FUNG|nr:3-hydroxyacyl-CoA dehydrogenase type-2 [Choanephora cucurbitarum]